MPKLSHENSINLLFLYLFFNTDNGNILLRRERKLSGLVERPGSTYWRVRHPLFSCNKWRGMKELSIFVDESGDFGEYDPHSPFYIISMVMHDQAVDITEDLAKLETQMQYLGLPHHCVHAGPIIRSEHEYKEYTVENKRKILRNMMTFTRKVDVKVKSIHIEKKNMDDSVEAVGKLSKLLAAFIRSNMDFFIGYDCVKIYYDNGQVEVSRILSSVFNVLLDNVEFRRVLPSEYSLFQVADLICTIKLAELKLEKHMLSKSEKFFFEDVSTLKKNYLKHISQKEM